MIGSGEGGLDLKVLVDSLSEPRGKLGTSVGDDLVGSSMGTPDPLEVDLVKTWGVESVRGGLNVYQLRAFVSHGQDSVLPFTRRQPCDEVRRDHSPWTRGGVNREEFTVGLSRIDLDMLTSVAISDPLFYILTKCRPIVVLPDVEEGSIASRMGGRRVIVKEAEEGLSEDGRDVDLAAVGP